MHVIMQICQISYDIVTLLPSWVYLLHKEQDQVSAVEMCCLQWNLPADSLAQT